MRDVVSFIRGIYGVCESCSHELSLRSDVQRIAKFGYGFAYQGRCPSCGAQTETIVDRKVHVAGVNYMKQVAADRTATDQILEPVTPAEEELLDFQDFLDTATDETIWAEILASS